MSCAVTIAPSHGMRAKPGRVLGNTTLGSGPYPEQGIQTRFVEGHMAMEIARQANTQHLPLLKFPGPQALRLPRVGLSQSLSSWHWFFIESVIARCNTYFKVTYPSQRGA